jgi:autotransporter-associated beta strand protein
MWLVEEKGLEQDGSYAYLRVEKMTNFLSSNPTFTDYYVAIAPYTITPFPGDTMGQVSTVLDTRILSLDWRNNEMVATQNVGISSDMDVHARWYVLSTAGAAPSLLQQGTLTPGAGIDTYMPSAALATDGSIGMTYDESSPVENMSMYVTGRTVSDPAGTMETPVLVKAGQQYYQGTRIGDFCGIAVDPVTGTTFWAVNEYAIATSDLTLPNWGTWIAAFQVITPTFTWTGSGTTTSWSDPNNWSGGVAPSPGSNLVFGPSATKFTSTNNFSGGTSFATITLSGGGYAISGNGIALTGGLDGSGATGSNTFGLNITLSAAETFQAGSGSASLTLSGAINNGGFLLTVGGGNGALNFTNTISGSGGLTLTNAGTTTLSGMGNTYTGSTTVQAGTLLLQETSGNAIPSALTIGAATVRLNGNNQIAATASVTVNSSGLLNTNNHSNTIGSLTLSGGSVTTGTGTLTVNGNVTASGSSVISGNLGLGVSMVTFTVNTLGTLTISAVVSGAAVLSNAGGGTLILSAANSYSGGTRLTAGTLSVGNNSALGAGTLTVTGGTLSATGGAVSLANAVILGGSLTFGGSNNLTLTGAVTLTGNRTLTVTSTGGITISGSLGQSGGTWALTKAGSGMLVLSGVNTYGGGTVLTAGTLSVGSASAIGTGILSLQGGTFSATGGPVSLANAVTLAGNATIGGTNRLTFTGAVTLTGNRTLTVINTGGTTISGAIGQSGGVWALTTAGSATLVLSGNNTYSGGTTISAGTLLINGTQSSGTVTVKSGGTLGGTGKFGPLSVSSGGTVFPGTSPSSTGILNSGNAAFASGSSFDVALNGTTAGSGYDQLNVTGTVSLGSSTLNVTLGFTPAIGTSFTIIHNTGGSPVVGTFKNLAEGATFVVNGETFRITYKGGSGNDVVITRIA